MLMTLLSLFGGGLMRLLPELLHWLNKKTDNEHELKMLDRQVQFEQLKSQNKINEMQAQGDIDQIIALMDAQKQALTSQMQKTGFKLVDSLNFLVRPLTTYYFLGFYGLSKIALFAIAFTNGSLSWQTVLQLYDETDRNILSGILAFWFVGRVFDKKATK